MSQVRVQVDVDEYASVEAVQSFTEAGHVVEVVTSNYEQGGASVWLNPQQARELAGALIGAAEVVEKKNTEQRA